MRIFPQSDKDYEFLPKPEAEGGLNEKHWHVLKKTWTHFRVLFSLFE